MSTINRRFFSYLSVLLLILALLLAGIGCAFFKSAPQRRDSALKKIHFFLPQFEDDLDYNGLADSIDLSLSYLKTLSPNQTFHFGKDRFNTDHMVRSLIHFKAFIETRPTEKNLKKFIRDNYRVYQSTGIDFSKDVLFTGYYEPIVSGSRFKTGEFRYPVYARPDDLLTIDLSLFSPQYKGQKIIGRYSGRTVLPYYDRKEIDRDHVLENRAQPLLWVKDPVDLFFLQIQGSGKVLLEDGRMINIHYHASNGRPYKSIGRLLINSGKIEKSEMSMQKIRAYLQEHPEEMEEILYYNPSYIFFKEEEEGPVGYLGFRLTPQRSLAVDRRIFPLPALSFIKTLKPVVGEDNMITGWSDFGRFLLSQDTGGAIRGPGRADIFWGNDLYAEIAAGHMQHKGELYFLVLKPER